ncbi:hypothetical protein AMTR_s00149p00030910 [Amborella trichopoda]|uniref:Uncharacterized protein n=1 Tax=Amborella trichopoda TaxID=13333 RepID=W1PPY1_AMBTC|nr:hypothetical protein AMTR_s00149p00030910 [Amborella trichopoda]
MERRRSIARRPSGTDGSDYSYRMVVDPRYTRVAQAKTRLSKLISLQAGSQLLGVLCALLSASWKNSSNKVFIASIIVGFGSLIIGELGRRNSRANFLKLYIVASSATAVLSLERIVTRDLLKLWNFYYTGEIQIDVSVEV